MAGYRLVFPIVTRNVSYVSTVSFKHNKYRDIHQNWIILNVSMWQNSMNSSYTPDYGGPLKYPCLRHCVQVSPSILANNTILKIYPQIWHGSSMYARMWIPLPFRVWDWMLRISTRPRTYRHVRTMITTTATEFTYVHECHLWFLTGNNDLNAFRIHQSGIASRGVWLQKKHAEH